MTDLSEYISKSKAKPDKTVDKVILVAGFGSEYKEDLMRSLGAIKNSVEEAFPDFGVRFAFLSHKAAERARLSCVVSKCSFDYVINSLINENVNTLIILPAHIIRGFVYDELVSAAEQYRTKFETLLIGSPLLKTDEDCDTLADALIEEASVYGEDTAVVFMGHGREYCSDSVYLKLQAKVLLKGGANIFIGTLKSVPSFNDVIKAVKAHGYNKIILQPLTASSGGHAHTDMAGDSPESWKSAFENQGIQVECVIKGLGEISSVRKLYVKHALEVIKKL